MIRALRSPGPARRFFKLGSLAHLLVYHPEQILELRDVAARPRLQIAPEAVDELIDRIRRYGQVIESVLGRPSPAFSAAAVEEERRMTKTIRREILIPQPREQVWRGLADSAVLAEWMFPNDFVPRVGHHFTFQVPPNPRVNFDGLVVRCEVLECEPPRENAGGRLAFSWSAGGLVDMRVSFQLEPDGQETRVLFEHSGFDVSQPRGNQAFRGAEFGWAKMLGQLPAVVAGLAADRD